MFLLDTLLKDKCIVFAGRVKIVSHLSCRTSASAMLKYFCLLIILISDFVVCFLESMLSDFSRFWLVYVAGLSMTWSETCSRGYKTFFMLNPTEHEISAAHKN